jgi:hypothetical protein
MIDLNLFRLRVFPSSQREFWNNLTPPEIFKNVVESLPSGELRRGNVWHIGNIDPIDQDWTYFRLGKTSRTKVEMYRNGNFVDAEFEAAPYTHVLVHYPLELVAIAKKTKLSPNVVHIANRLRRLLAYSSKGRDFRARFEISPINDPQSFIAMLQSAFSVTRFSYEFSRKNIFDIDKDFIDPLERTIEAVDGKKGVAVLKGEALKSGPLEAISRSAASTGDEVSATLKTSRRARKVRKKMRGNAATVQVEDLDGTAQMKKAANDVMNKYLQVRGPNTHNTQDDIEKDS